MRSAPGSTTSAGSPKVPSRSISRSCCQLSGSVSSLARLISTARSRIASCRVSESAPPSSASPSSALTARYRLESPAVASALLGRTEATARLTLSSPNPVPLPWVPSGFPLVPTNNAALEMARVVSVAFSRSPVEETLSRPLPSRSTSTGWIRRAKSAEAVTKSKIFRLSRLPEKRSLRD